MTLTMQVEVVCTNREQSCFESQSKSHRGATGVRQGAIAMQLQLLRVRSCVAVQQGQNRERLQCSYLTSDVCESYTGRSSCSYHCSGVCGKLPRGLTGVRQGRLLCCYCSSGVGEKYTGARGVAMQLRLLRDV